jgi:hypothetical protein
MDHRFWTVAGLATSLCACGDDLTGSICGPGTVEADGMCVAVCSDGTQLPDGTCVPDELEPDEFRTPLVELFSAPGLQLHQHTDEMRYLRVPPVEFTSPSGAGLLAVCALTSVSIMDASSPPNYSWTYLTQDLQHVIPIGPRVEGGCVHLSWSDTDPRLVFTTQPGDIDHSPFLSGWDLNPSPWDPLASSFGPSIKMEPRQLGVLQEPGVAYGGVDAANGHIYVAIHTGGLAIYDYDVPSETFTRIGTVEEGLQNAWGVRVRGNTAFVTDQELGLVTVDVTDPLAPVVLGSVSLGTASFGLALDRDRPDIAYVAAGTAGVAVIDIGDLARPEVLTKIPTPGLSMRVDQAAGQLHVAAWRDARAYDVSKPAEPRFIGARRFTVEAGVPDDSYPRVTTTVRGIAVADETIGPGGIWRPDPIMLAGVWDSPVFLRVHADRRAPNLLLPEQVDHIDFGTVEVGSSKPLFVPVTNQGTARLTLYDNEVDSDAFTVSPAQLRLNPGETKTLELTYTPGSAESETSYLSLRSDDPDQPIRLAYLVGNQAGAGVGEAAPEVRVDTIDGGEWISTSAENAGKVQLLAYFATF